MSDTETKFEQWCVVELMGHRKLAGRVSEATWPPGWMRIDIPGPDDTFVTQFYNPVAGYGLTPVTEELARRFAERNRPTPVTVYELPAAPHNAALDSDEPAGDDWDDDGDEEVTP